jgi:septal ring factor EnvC (AmiA/AmiB activator)
MKTLKVILLLVVLFLGVNSGRAQFGGMNGGMYGGGMNQMQNQQSMQNTNNYGRNKSSDDLDKEREANLAKSIEKISKDLNLDDLQIIVIKKEIEASSKSIFAISKSEASDEDKIKEMDAINEKTDRTINTFLNADQKVKYKKYIDDRKERMDKLRMTIRN